MPPGYAVKGSSTLYKDGNVALQWVKTEADKQAQFDAMISRIELACEGIKPWKPVKQPKQVEENLLSLLVITDFHLGSYCWGDETSEDYNTDMARDLFLSSIKEMIDSTPKSKVGLLCNLGDFLHWDGLLQVTPTSAHILDNDSRYSRIVDIAMTVMNEAVRMMLEKYEKVVFVCAEGNMISPAPSGCVSSLESCTPMSQGWMLSTMTSLLRLQAWQNTAVLPPRA